MNYEEKIEKIDHLLKQVYLDLDKGVIRWLYSGTGRTLDKIVGTVTSSGYRSVWCSGNRIQYHQIIFYASRGYIPQSGRVIDHIDRDRLNNAISNLRDVTAAENAQNANLSKNSTTGYNGVYYSKANSNWSSHIYRNRKRIFIGAFPSVEEATAARIDVENNINNLSKYRKRKTYQ